MKVKNTDFRGCFPCVDQANSDWMSIFSGDCLKKRRIISGYIYGDYNNAYGCY
ncbi:MAG: hypothetical protein ACYC54_04985 [Sedimentisphaerales bacterium]